jgi:cytoskeletal protein CcmA (bactofilin family)
MAAPVSNPSSTLSGNPSVAPCNIGPRIAIRGNITGEEDLIIEGRVEGSIALNGHLGVAQAAVIEADLEVDSVDIHGQIDGDIIAVTTITLHEGSRVVGNLRAPSIVINDGAQFKGTVEMDVPLPASVTRQQRR